MKERGEKRGRKKREEGETRRGEERGGGRRGEMRREKSGIKELIRQEEKRR